ncbi:putative protease [Cystoisospora suis]|uniref:Putative protease n=1 Tax=Cystoisospora suis TaxID=483139 RepID=A0A2C6L5P2_9APIC|nr:putative protease [Cystoisospora suis]
MGACLRCYEFPSGFCLASGTAVAVSVLTQIVPCGDSAAQTIARPTLVLKTATPRNHGSDYVCFSDSSRFVWESSAQKYPASGSTFVAFGWVFAVHTAFHVSRRSLLSTVPMQWSELQPPFSFCPSTSSSRVLPSMPAGTTTREALSALNEVLCSCPPSPAGSPSSHVSCPRYLSCRRSLSTFSSSSRLCFSAPDGDRAAAFSSPSSPSALCSWSARSLPRNTLQNPSADSDPGLCPAALNSPSSPTVVADLYSVPPMPTLSPILCFLPGWQLFSSSAAGPKTVFSPQGCMRTKGVLPRGHYPFTVLRGVALHIAWFLIYLSVLASVWLTSPSVQFFPFFPASFFFHHTPLLSPGSISTYPAAPAYQVSRPRANNFQRSLKHNGTADTCTLSIGPSAAHFFSTSPPADPDLEVPFPVLSLQSCPCEVFGQHAYRLQKGDISQSCRCCSCLSETRADARISLPHEKETPAATFPFRYLSSESQDEAEPTRPGSREQPGKSGQIRSESGPKPQNVFSFLSFGVNPLLFAKALSVPGSSGYTKVPLSASLFPGLPRSYSLFRAFSARAHKEDQPLRHPSFPEPLLDLRGGYKNDQKDGTAERPSSEPSRLTTTPEDKSSCSPISPHESATTSACETSITCPDSTTSPSGSPSFSCSSPRHIPEKNETAVNSLKGCNNVFDPSQRDSDDRAVPRTSVGNGLQSLPMGRRRRIVRGSDLLQGERREEKPVLRFVGSRASGGDAAARTTAPCGGGNRGTQPDEVEELELEDEDDVQVVVSPSALRSLLRAPACGRPDMLSLEPASRSSVALLYGVVLPPGPSLGETEDNTSPPLYAPRREPALRLGSRVAEKKQKKKLILRVEAAVVLPCGQSNVGVHAQEEHCQGKNQTQAGEEEAFKELQQLLGPSSPTRAAADRVAAHLGLQLLGWASLRPPRMQRAELGVKGDSDEDKQDTERKELNLRWRERRREGARQIVFGRQENSEREEDRKRERRAGAREGTNEEWPQNKPQSTALTPTELLLTMILQTEQSHRTENASIPPPRSATWLLRQDGSSLSSSARYPPSSVAPPLIGLVVQRAIAGVPGSGGPAGVQDSSCHPSTIEIEAFTSTRHGRRVFETGLLPPVSALPSGKYEQEQDDKKQNGASRGDKRTRTTVSLKSANSYGGGSSSAGYPSRRSPIFSVRKMKRVQGHELFSKEKAKQEEEERKLLAKVFELKGPIEVDGLNYTHLPAEFFYRYLPVSAATVPSLSCQGQHRQRKKQQDRKAREEEDGESQDGFESSEEHGADFFTLFFDDGEDSFLGPEQRGGCSSSVTQEDEAVRLKNILKAQLPSSRLLRHLRSFPILTQVAGLLHNNDQDLQLICDALRRSSSMAPSPAVSQTSVTEGRDEQGNWRRVEVTTTASPEIPLRIIRLLQALLDSNTS